MKSMRTTYYIAICVFLLCLVMIVVKMTFWPVCAGSTACDGWTVAGLTATILGTAAAFLGILGAILLAAWWTGLDERVEARVADAFKAKIQTVQSTINQLDTQMQTVGEQYKGIQDSITQLNTQLKEVGDQARQIAKMQSQLDTLVKKSRQQLDSLDKRTEHLRDIMTTHDVQAALIQNPEQ